MNIDQMAHEYLVAEVARVGLASIDLDRVNQAIGLARNLKRKLKQESEMRNGVKEAHCDHDSYNWDKVSDEPDLQFICTGCGTNPNDDPVYMNKVLGIEAERHG
ncbi:hypothetical protein I6M90_01035 [Acinetobacter bereziniae]|uniref:hypothetical protein n=1 Tax=Acinetobacter bereziniae TaxID=106648 RepID=UPI0018FFF0B2|nr:hypothetical protein [Acinetobacter bereziniae]MBJ8450308.1 hypothetical protein [Acinetobacter bereziniae]MBJ8454657.1 hypothetical protein [Acinetobacter bereziniae]